MPGLEGSWGTVWPELCRAICVWLKENEAQCAGCGTYISMANKFYVIMTQKKQLQKYNKSQKELSNACNGCQKRLNALSL